MPIYEIILAAVFGTLAIIVMIPTLILGIFAFICKLIDIIKEIKE